MSKSLYLIIGLLVLIVGVVGGYVYIQNSKSGIYFGNNLKIENGAILITSSDKVAGFPLNLDLNINCTSQDLSGVTYYNSSKVVKKFVFPKGSNLGAFIPAGTPVVVLTKREEYPQVHTVVVPQLLCSDK